MYKTIIVLALLTNLTISCQMKNDKNVVHNDANLIVRSLINNWNIAHNTKNISIFSNIYSDSVNFYGLNKSKNECLINKLELLEKYKNFNQEIGSDLSIKIINSNLILCNFTKMVSFKNTFKNYPSFLYIKRIEDKWLITTENDSITLKNISLKKNSQKKITNEDIISICKTSPNIKFNFNKECVISYDEQKKQYSIWCFSIASSGEDDPGSTRTFGRYIFDVKNLKLIDITLGEDEFLFFDKEFASKVINK